MDKLFQSRGGDFQTTAAKTLLGNIIITRYNNKTYRIDDILWKEDCNKKFPVSTFLYHLGILDFRNMVHVRLVGRIKMFNTERFVMRTQSRSTLKVTVRFTC